MVSCREIYFIEPHFAGEKKKTKAIDNELNPVWNEVRDSNKFYNGFILNQTINAPPPLFF